MAGCCEEKACELEDLRASQSRVLWIVLAVNAAMFVAELTVGLIAGSVALQADSLDMLGDALVYGFSLYVVTKSMRWRAASALLKGGVMALFGVATLVQSVYRILYGSVPEAELIGIMGAVALAANGFCLYLLTRHRADDVNMRSTWLCSRNDIIANCSVLVAAGLVAITGTLWPDIAVGLIITSLFLKTSYTVIRESLGELKKRSPGSHPRIAADIRSV
ncbi:MAG: cation diffusion facilitator family transporter [bacterium]|nr:cation diffusion facilitator family transporter [bacterium]